MALAGDKKEIEQKIRALAGDGFNADFEELVIRKVATLLGLGVSKRHLLDFLDLAIATKGRTG